MNRLDKLLAVYRNHISLPWPSGVAAIERVVFAVYDKEDELRLRARIDDFAQATSAAEKRWQGIDLTHAFPEWLGRQEYREAYFKAPHHMAGYPAGEVTGFVRDLIERLRKQVNSSADAGTVTALHGLGALFGLARVSTLVEGIKDVIPGRLLAFFPGEHHPETHSYRLLDARDGWNYLAIPLSADQQA